MEPHQHRQPGLLCLGSGEIQLLTNVHDGENAPSRPIILPSRGRRRALLLHSRLGRDEGALPSPLASLRATLVSHIL